MASKNVPEKRIDLLYLCDGKACKNCSEYCHHTSDITHAVHRYDLHGRKFKYIANCTYIGMFEIESEE